MNRQPGKFWAYVAVVAGFPLTLAGLSAALGFLAVPTLAPAGDAFSWALGVMATIFLGLICGPLALYHGLASIQGRPSGPMRWPAVYFFGIAFALALGLGLAVANFHVAEGYLFPPLFLLGAALPPLSALAWAARRLGWPLTWRQGALALVAGSTLSVLVAVVLEGAFGVITYLLMAPLRYNLAPVGTDVVSRLFFSPALALFLVATALQAPIPEEFAKALAAALFGRQRIASERQAFALGMAAGAGFAILENMLYEGLYATQAGWGWGSVTLLRGLGAALHPIGAGLVTLGWYRARERGWGELLKAYAVAVGLHTAWNGGFSAFVYVTGLDYYSRSATVSVYGKPIQITLVAFLAALALFIWWLLRRLVLGLGQGVEPDLSPVVVSRRAVATWAMACALVAVPLGAAVGPAYAPIQAVVLAGLPTPAPTATPTATRAATPRPAASATRTATPRPSPTPDARATATAQAAQATATAYAGWPSAFLDEFNDNAHKWPTGGATNDYLDGSRLLSDGKYVYEATAKKGFVSRQAPTVGSFAACNFAVTVEARQASGTSDARFGLAFRVSAGDYYLFTISGDSRYGLSAYVSSTWTTLVSRTSSAAIRPREANRLTVIADESHLTLFINDQRVEALDDTRISCGSTAVVIELSEAGDQAAVEFDNFQVRAPGAVPAAAPTVAATGGHAQWPSAFLDEFNDNAHKWPSGRESGRWYAQTRTLDAGKYIWEAGFNSGAGLFERASPAADENRSRCDFSVSVEARQLSGSNSAEYGLAFRVSEPRYYRFTIDELGRFRLTYMVSSQLQSMIGLTSSSAIRPGKVNRLTAVAEGSLLTLFINDQQVGAVEDRDLPCGGAALAIALAKADDQAVFEFDNFQVRAPGAAPAASPAVPSTSAPVPPSTVTREAGEPRALATAVPGGAWPTRFQEEFSDNALKWPTGAARDDFFSGTRALVDGKYVIEATAERSFIRWHQPAIGMYSACTFRVDVDGRLVSGPSTAKVGLAFRTTSAGDYYYFSLTGDGRYALLANISPRWYTLAWPTPLAVFRPGETNRLTAVADGSRLTVSINGQQVAAIDDSYIGCGGTAMVIELANAGDHAVFEFDNYEVRAP